MKKILLFGTLVGVLFSSCGTSPRGELVGVQDLEEFYPTEPYGMVHIPRGTHTMGANDGDVPYAHTTPKKLVTMHSFYMDQTEITNNEYRQFVHWVRDSIARTLLAENFDEETYMVTEKDGELLDEPYLNWDVEIQWDDDEIIESEALYDMYIPEEERIMGQKDFDTRFWKYKYSWLDKSEAGQKANRFDRESGTYREGFSRQGLVKEAEVYIYPDTLTWLHDFSYTFNEPMFDTYFWHPAYGEYPVVGVNWEQAKAFCNWRTDYRLSLLTPYERKYETEYRLPTEI